MTQKTTIPHPSEAKNDADHVKFAKHMMGQIEAGHYAIKNVSVSQTKNGNEYYHFASWTTHEIDPSVEAHPHNLA